MLQYVPSQKCITVIEPIGHERRDKTGGDLRIQDASHLQCDACRYFAGRAL